MIPSIRDELQHKGILSHDIEFTYTTTSEFELRLWGGRSQLVYHPSWWMQQYYWWVLIITTSNFQWKFIAGLLWKKMVWSQVGLYTPQKKKKTRGNLIWSTKDSTSTSGHENLFSILDKLFLGHWTAQLLSKATLYASLSLSVPSGAKRVPH